MQPAPDQSLPPTPKAQSGAASILPADEIAAIRAYHARLNAKERARDARMLAAYQRDCLASWEGRK